MRTRNLFLTTAVLASAGFVPHQAPAPAKYALVVGINDYTNFADEIGGDLYGAVNDARAIRDVLIARWGYEPGNVKLLLDGEATRAAIEQAFTAWAPGVLRPGDQFVFFFAGHGSQMWDLDGDEEDGLDETFCPVDVIKGDTENDIPDDDLAVWLDRLPTDDIIVLWDKCHAGTSTRAVTPFSRPRSLDRTVTSDVPRPAEARGEVRIGAAGEALTDAPSKPILELAASGADEVAVDAVFPADEGEVYGGAFTHFLVRNLWRLPPGTSYGEVFRHTREDLKRERFAQTPEINGSRATEPLFGLDEAVAAASVPVVSVQGGTVRLGGGAQAGITAGSIYEVAGVTLRVERVAAGEATATVVSGKSGAVRPGAAAKLVAFHLPKPELRVSIAGLAEGTRGEIRAGAGRQTGLVLVEGARDFAHLLLRPADNGGYVVLGLDGAVRHEVAPAGAGATLAEILKKEAGAHQLSALDNPARPFPLEFSFTGDKSRFQLNETIEFRIRPGADGYLTVVDLGTDGTVSVIYPNDFVRDNRVGGGQEIVIPSPEWGVAFAAQPPAGRGIVRAFLTQRPLDLRLSGSDPMQAARVADALRRSAGGEPGGAIPVEGWATSAILYEITR